MSPSDTVEQRPAAPGSGGWRELYLKEDWWAIWLGLAIVLAAWAWYAAGSSIQWIAVAPAKWAAFPDLTAHFSANAGRYLAQFLLWLIVLGIAVRAMGLALREFVPAFVFVYVVAMAIHTLGAWQYASRYNLEPPLVALLIGMLIANFIGLPKWMDAGFRVEFYIKTGIVLLGATLPFTLIVWAGPIAVLQATIVSVTTFMVIFLAGRRLGLDRRLCATMGAGGAVCGVSAAIAISAAVGARREHAPVAITLVIIWAVIMIFALPLACRALELHAGVAGAWIGTSEFADAAGLAAAQAYGNLADSLPEIEGTSEDAVRAFTLMKVVGRDVWIGIWAFILSIIATTRWETEGTQAKPDVAQIWWRFPKFVLGFAAASVIVTAIAGWYGQAEFDQVVTPALVTPIKTLRTWAFIFCFFSIGLTTRFRELAAAGLRPFTAFTAGVVINVIIGFVLSVIVFAGYWSSLGR
ncbi:MAG: putative sulfate exporter family transporter [Gammaproteobacteria bacterium]|nr:putative sulfate exporter family transporter [Gammaproteobacteria bacterium]